MSNAGKKARSAMLRTQYALDHHAKTLNPIKSALQNALDWSGIMHSSGSSRGGSNSNYLLLEDGRKYYIRARMHSGPRPYISIRRKGASIASEVRLFNERDAIRFVESL